MGRSANLIWSLPNIVPTTAAEHRVKASHARVDRGSRGPASFGRAMKLVAPSDRAPAYESPRLTIAGMIPGPGLENGHPGAYVRQVCGHGRRAARMLARLCGRATR